MDIKEAHHRFHSSEARHPWESARFEVLYSLIKEYMPQIMGRRNTIVDIGCGDMFFIENLARRMPDSRFVAIDPALDEDMVKMFSDKLARFNIKIFNSWETATQNSPDKADIVLLLDVIEHVADDISLLKSLKTSTIITDETIFMITVPAFQGLFCSRDRFLGHERRYNNRQLKNTIKKAGLKEISSGYFFFSLLPLRLLQVFIEKIVPVRPESVKGIGNWKGTRIWDTLIKNLLIADFKIASFLRNKWINPVGLSNFMICKRSV